MKPVDQATEEPWRDSLNPVELNPVKSSTVTSGRDTDMCDGSPPGREADDPFLESLFQRIHSIRTTEPKAPGSISLRGKLRARRKIGAGGLGAVYCYWDSTLKRDVALKVINSDAMRSRGRLQRFLREQAITAKLQHPAIPPVYQSGKMPDGRPFYVMKLIEGETLLARLKRLSGGDSIARLLSSERLMLLDAFLNVCDAAQHAHDHGVIHRDIKPANIMIENSGVAFLVDWGLARQETLNEDGSDIPAVIGDEVSQATSDELTYDGQQLGTLDWMSPEQAAGQADHHSKATDVYGLGATLFHILSGTAPHAAHRTGGVSVPERLALIANGPTPLAEHGNKEVPPELASICERAMNRDPLQRYSSPAELKADIRRWQQREPVIAHRGRYSILNRAGLFVSRHQKGLTIGLLALVALTVGTGWSAFRISQSAAAAESALSSQRKSNEQLFASLEKYAETVMSEEVLASPQLKALRASIMADLVRQYEIWSLQTGSTPEEQLRAARGSARLAEIELQTGNIQQAIVSAARSAKLSEEAIANLNQATSDQIQPALRARRILVEVTIQTGDFPKSEHALEEMERLLERFGKRLTPFALLTEKASFHQLQTNLAYHRSRRTAIQTEAHEFLNHATSHAVQALGHRIAANELQPGTDNQLAVAAALNLLALMYHKNGPVEEAKAQYEKALAVLDRIDSVDTSAKKDVDRLRVTVLFNAIMTYRTLGDFAAARKCAEDGLDICKKSIESAPLILRNREDLGRGYGNLAEVLLDQYWIQQEKNACEDLLVTTRRAGETYLALFNDYPDRSSMKSNAAIHYLRLSGYLHWENRDDESLEEFARSVSLGADLLDLEPGHLVNAMHIASGYALIRERGGIPGIDTKTAEERMIAALRVARTGFVVAKVYRDWFLNDRLFQDAREVPYVEELTEELKELKDEQ